MTTTEIANRLTAIEAELAALKAQSSPSGQAHPIKALEGIHAIFENDQAFKEATRLGRKWRKSDRPAAGPTRAKRR